MEYLYQVCLIFVICIQTVKGFRNDFWIMPELANKMCPIEDKDFEYTISPSLLSCVYACMKRSTCTSIFYDDKTRNCTGCTLYYEENSQMLGDFSGTVHATLHPSKPATACNVACTNSMDGDVRLCDGSSQGVCHPKQGRIEVFHLGQWGTVCDDVFSVDMMNVICKQFGYTNGGEAKDYAYYGRGVGTIWMDNVQCIGNETSLLDCSHRGWGVSSHCQHFEDLGVSCY